MPRFGLQVRHYLTPRCWHPWLYLSGPWNMHENLSDWPIRCEMRMQKFGKQNVRQLAGSRGTRPRVIELWKRLKPTINNTPLPTSHYAHFHMSRRAESQVLKYFAKLYFHPLRTLLILFLWLLLRPWTCAGIITPTLSGLKLANLCDNKNA